MDKYIGEQFLKTGIFGPLLRVQINQINWRWTTLILTQTITLDHNLQFLTPQENTERSHSRPCIIWEMAKRCRKRIPIGYSCSQGDEI